MIKNVNICVDLVLRRDVLGDCDAVTGLSQFRAKIVCDDFFTLFMFFALILAFLLTQSKRSIHIPIGIFEKLSHRYGERGCLSHRDGSWLM